MTISVTPFGQLFQLFDADSSGSITLPDLRKVMDMVSFSHVCKGTSSFATLAREFFEILTKSWWRQECADFALCKLTDTNFGGRNTFGTSRSLLHRKLVLLPMNCDEKRQKGASTFWQACE